MAMPRLLRLLLGSLRRLFSSRRNLWLENLALRQQLMVFKPRRSRPKIGNLDKLFWLVARRFWCQWKSALVLVTPETVVRWLSRNRRAFGRKRISKELRELIFRMVAENPTWGAPRIHGELLKLGFDVAERTVFALGSEGDEGPAPCVALASVSAKSPRGNCGNAYSQMCCTDGALSVLARDS